MNSVVLDHTALSALGRGHRIVAEFLSSAHTHPDRHVYAPALCLAAAVADRPPLADHIGALPAIEIIELSYASASAVGKLVATGVDWRAAQAVHAGRPTLDWPTGRPVVTASPATYAGCGITVINLN